MSKKGILKIMKKTSYPYIVEFSTDEGYSWTTHSYIQTPSEERVFARLANRAAWYRIAA